MEIIGIGTDIEEVGKVRASLKNERFLDEIFTCAEKKYALGKFDAAQTAAGLFCAKEAFFKAIGTGLGTYRLREVEICHDGSGRPYFSFSGALFSLVERENLCFFLSVSHTKSCAVACVVGCRRSEKERVL